MVDDLMEEVSLLFFLCSYVRQVADPSSMSNLKGLLVDCLAPSQDLRKHDVPAVEFAPQAGEVLPFRVQAFWCNKSSDLLMAMTSQRHEEAVHNGSKRLPKTEPSRKSTDFPRSCFQAPF